MEKQLNNTRKRSRNRRFLVLTLFPAYFLFCGLVLEPFDDIVKGMIIIFQEPDFLITDYIALGGVGAAFVNAALVTLMSIAIIYFLNMDINGSTIASIFLMMGFSLFGKNIVNIWAILFGVGLYARYHRQHMSQYIHVAFYGTSLSPIITQLVTLSHLHSIYAFTLGILIGLMMGFVLPPLANNLIHAHRGYCLYNAGFAGGLIATIVVSVMKSFGIQIDSRDIWYTGSNVMFMQILISFFLILIILGMISEPRFFWKYLDILKHAGRGGTDYCTEEGLGATLFNMGINGIAATVFVVAVGSDLNGPTMGGIFTIVGFSATGKHIRNVVPVIFGVWLASLVSIWNITDHKAILAALFSATLAPIAGQFGVIWGIVAGFLHASLSLNVGLINSGMNLYNNGFAGGLVATALVPVIISIKSRPINPKDLLDNILSMTKEPKKKEGKKH